MDKYSSQHCAVCNIPIPDFLSGIARVYRVADDGLAPRVSTGDLVCCGDPTAWCNFPKLIIVDKSMSWGGGARLIYNLQLYDLANIWPVSFIIKR